jgi:signal transduction histidine kinase/PAS domain-containing protein
MNLRVAMGTADPSLLYFSARASAGDVALPAGVRRVDELPGCHEGAHGRNDVLIIDVGAPGDVDAARLAKIKGYAASRSGVNAARPGVGLALLGDVSLLDAPEHVVWLRPDGVWPSWPSRSYAEKAVGALRERVAQRVQAREDIQPYRRLCRELKIGAYCTRLDGSGFVWADREVASILGYDSVSDLHAAGRSPLDCYADARQRTDFVRRLEGPPRRPGSVAVDLIRADGRRARVRIVAILIEEAGQEVILGFLHDFSDLVDEHEQIARQRLADLLDQLGYAYFAMDLDGRTLATSRRDAELLDCPPEQVRTEPRQRWWGSDEERQSWLAKLLADGKATEYPMLLRTYEDRHRWVDSDCRVMKNGSGDPVGVEGIYRDATASRFADRMSRALSMVGASDEGVSPTAQTICEWAASLFDAPACALMLRDDTHGRVFPTYVWLASGPWSGRGAAGRGLIFDERAGGWLAELPGRDVHCEPAERVRQDVTPLFGEHAAAMGSLGVISLRTGSSARDLGDPKAPVRGYLWIPITRSLAFSEDRFDGEFLGFSQLCSRQLTLASGRDAFDLVHKLLIERSSTAGVSELDKSLGLAREALQARVPMEGCSIFRTGIEERRTTLQLVSTSGLVGAEVGVTYELGDGLSGQTALRRQPRISFDKTNEPGYLGRHVEKTGHTGQTWMGVPMVDRKGQTIGLIRCVNRLIGAGEPSVTGFSVLDCRVVEEFAHACALLTELSLLQEERSRALARITHEIRTPTVGIRNNVRFLSLYYRDPQQPEHKIKAKLADLELDALILVNLLGQVDMVRGRAGNHGREPRAQTNVAAIIQKTFHQLVPELNARKISQDGVDIELYRMAPLWLPQAAVAQIVFNLFTNAIKYSHADPQRFRLEIRAEETPHAFRVHFRDWGIGVEDVYRERIFQDEFRTPTAQRHDARGLGLGLKISRKLAGGFGGHLLLESTHNPTDFVLVLPRTSGWKL